MISLDPNGLYLTGAIPKTKPVIYLHFKSVNDQRLDFFGLFNPSIITVIDFPLVLFSQWVNFCLCWQIFLCNSLCRAVQSMLREQSGDSRQSSSIAIMPRISNIWNIFCVRKLKRFPITHAGKYYNRLKYIQIRPSVLTLNCCCQSKRQFIGGSWNHLMII